MPCEGTLCLSPHCDDIPLSIGATFLSGCLPQPVHVVVLFSQSRYTRSGGFRGSVGATSALRQAEELRAASVAGYSVSFITFGEPFVRPGYRTPRDIFNPRLLPEKEAVWQQMKQTVEDIIASHRGPVIGPLGCGDHIDHRIASACLREMAQHCTDTVPMFYEDLYYAARMADERIVALVPKDIAGCSFVPVLFGEGLLPAKQQLLDLYNSQIGKFEKRSVEKHWKRLGGYERLWVPASSIALVVGDQILRR